MSFTVLLHQVTPVSDLVRVCVFFAGDYSRPMRSSGPPCLTWFRGPHFLVLTVASLDFFSPPPLLAHQAGTETVLARIKGAKKLPGVTDIMLPGEGGSARSAAVVAAGVATVEKNLYEGMKKV